MAQPRYSLKDKTSPKINAPNITAKTDSRLNKRVTTVGLEPLCASICNVYATPEENTPTYKTCQMQLYLTDNEGVSKIKAQTKEKSETKKNCIKDK